MATLASLKAEIDRLKRRMCCSRILNYTSAERDSLSSPFEGQIIYNTTTDKMNFYNGTNWEEVTSTEIPLPTTTTTTTTP